MGFLGLWLSKLFRPNRWAVALGFTGTVLVQASISPTASLHVKRSHHTATLLPTGEVLLVGGGGNNGYNVTTECEVFDPVSATVRTLHYGSLSAARGEHTATLLPNGKILIAGGRYNGSPLNSAELLDGGNQATTGNLVWKRGDHTATLLPNGKVLLVGGAEGSTSALYSAELYDPATGTFSLTSGTPRWARNFHTATLLSNGKVLILGGFFSPTAEVYDPGTGTFSATGSLAIARTEHTTTLLPNGKVLVTGGRASNGTTLTSSEVFDPATGTFSPAGNLQSARQGHTAILLPNGKVWIAGGYRYLSTPEGNYPTLATTELYDPVSGTFSASDTLGTARTFHTASLLANGKVLVSGGMVGAKLYDLTPTQEVFDPQDPNPGEFTATANLDAAAFLHSSTPLPSGKILLAGGLEASASSRARLFDPTSGTFTATGSLNFARYKHTATRLPQGTVLVTGGLGSMGADGSAELYDPGTGIFSFVGSLRNARREHSATLLPNGKVLIVGGLSGNYLASSELYDPATRTFSYTGNLNTARARHTATLLPNGLVLIAGGQNSAFLATAELYNPTTGTFTLAKGWYYNPQTGYFVESNGLATPRSSHTATLLGNGMVLIAGGTNATAPALASTELFDFYANSFKPSPNMSTPRVAHTATTLPNGKVLLAGGLAGTVFSQPLLSAEVFDPFTGVFSATGSLGTARRSHSAILLSNGRTLLTGGYNGVALVSAEAYR